MTFFNLPLNCELYCTPPLSEKEIRMYEYGSIFQSHSYFPQSINYYLDGSSPPPVFPIGYQPFFRCSAQYAWAAELPYPFSLTEAHPTFRKFRFQHNSKLIEEIFYIMEEGGIIYPNEGLCRLQNQIDQISETKEFTVEAIELYAKDNSIPVKNLLGIINTKGYNLTPMKLYNIQKSDIDAINDFYCKNNQLENLSIVSRTVYYPKDNPR